jgi:hypothetical protein
MIDPEQIDKLYGPRWLIRGATLMAVCIVGEYIGRIYRHLNRAPQFVIREKFIWPIGASSDPQGLSAGRSGFGSDAGQGPSLS